MRIEFTKRTVRKLRENLKRYTKFGNPNQIRKISAILMLALNVKEDVITAMFDISLKTLYNWRNAYLSDGMKSFVSKRRGNICKLSINQKEELKEIMLKSPSEHGFTRETWTSKMACEVIKRKYRVSYNHRYVCELLKQIGLSYQKSKFIPTQRDLEDRQAWKNEKWPQLMERAKRENAALLFEDEVGFALWGSLGYTWAEKGKQPLVKTIGRRKNIKAFGAVDFFTGRFIFQTEEKKLNSKSYISFLKKILRRFSGKIILIHDGAPYHKSKDTKSFLESVNERVEVIRLPIYSPDFNLIEHLWKKAKARTHNKFFPDFQSLRKYVKRVLRYFQRNVSEILNLCSSYDKMLHDIILLAA